MIYLVTKNKELFDNNIYKIISVKESLELLDPLVEVGLDTETSSLDCHSGKLLSVQLGCYDFQVVIDCSTIDILLYKDYLTSDRLFIGHNLKFDLKWLYLYHIVPQRIYDTYMGELCLWNGYPIIITPETYYKIKCDRYQYVEGDGKSKKAHYILSTSLKTISKLYLGIELDKSIRGQIIWKGLSDSSVVKYAADDVKYMSKLKEIQLEKLKEKGLEKAIDLLNRSTFHVAYAEFCGVRLNLEKWDQKIKKDKQDLLNLSKKMDEWLIANCPNSKYVKVNKQGSLFDGFDTEPKAVINWGSVKQVIPLFRSLGITVEVESKNGTSESINAKSLGPQKNKCELIPLYLKYKEKDKLVGTYGENVKKQIRENGRLYSRYNVKGTDTFRVSSGGKEQSGLKYINLLNIPSDSFTRSCFIAEEGNRWISMDYKGQESFLMASIANDKAMIHELMEGEKDLHTLTAKIVYPEIPRDMSADEVKKEYHDYRKKAKGYEFAFNYGGNDFTIMRNFGLTRQKAKEIYNSYMSGFYGLKRYQDYRRMDWKRKGYIDLCPNTFGFKAFIYDFPYLAEFSHKLNSAEYNSYYNEMKESNPECDTVRNRKEYYTRISESDRQSINYPIQHAGALCSMVSLILFFNTLRKRGWLFKVLITIIPYDEINCEAPEEIAEEVADILHKCMIKAGSCFCTRCTLDADISRHKICTKDFVFNDKIVMSKGDIIAAEDEDHLYNMNKGITLKVKDLPKSYKDCLDDNGPLPTYWVH